MVENICDIQGKAFVAIFMTKQIFVIFVKIWNRIDICSLLTTFFFFLLFNLHFTISPAGHTNDVNVYCVRAREYHVKSLGIVTELRFTIPSQRKTFDSVTKIQRNHGTRSRSPSNGILAENDNDDFRIVGVFFFFSIGSFSRTLERKVEFLERSGWSGLLEAPRLERRQSQCRAEPEWKANVLAKPYRLSRSWSYLRLDRHFYLDVDGGQTAPFSGLSSFPWKFTRCSILAWLATCQPWKNSRARALTR